MAKSTIDIDDPTMNDTIRLRRLEREAAMIAQADASVAAGRPCSGGHRAFYRVFPDTGRNDTAGDVGVLRVFGPGQDRNQALLTV